MTRLEKIYREKVVPVLQKEFNYTSSMQLPGIEKISLNIGLGAATQNNKIMEEAVAELTAIAGQKAVVTRAKKSIAHRRSRHPAQGPHVGLPGQAHELCPAPGARLPRHSGSRL